MEQAKVPGTAGWSSFSQSWKLCCSIACTYRDTKGWASARPADIDSYLTGIAWLPLLQAVAVHQAPGALDVHPTVGPWLTIRAMLTACLMAIPYYNPGP